MSVLDFGHKDNQTNFNYVYETETERRQRLIKERIQKELYEEEKMLSGEIEVDEHKLLNRVEHFVFHTNVCYSALCEHALYNRPAWMIVIRKNTQHLTSLIESYTKRRQHNENLHPTGNSNLPRNVTYDTKSEFE